MAISRVSPYKSDAIGERTVYENFVVNGILRNVIDLAINARGRKNVVVDINKICGDVHGLILQADTKLREIFDNIPPAATRHVAEKVIIRGLFENGLLPTRDIQYLLPLLKISDRIRQATQAALLAGSDLEIVFNK